MYGVRMSNVPHLLNGKLVIQARKVVTTESRPRGVLPPAGVPNWTLLQRGSLHMARVSAQYAVCPASYPGLCRRMMASTRPKALPFGPAWSSPLSPETPAVWRSTPWPGPLHDPPQLSCLLVGDLPGFPDERRLRDRRPSIDLLWEMLAMKLWRVRRLIVRHGVPRSRQGNHDLATLHFDVKVVGSSPASR